MNRTLHRAFGRAFVAALCALVLAGCESTDEAQAVAACYADGFVAGRAQQDALKPERYFPAEAEKWSPAAKMSYALGFSDGGTRRGSPLPPAELRRYFARGYEDGMKTGHTRRQTSIMYVPLEGAGWPEAAKMSYGRGYHMGDGARTMREWEKQGHRFQQRPASMSWPGDLRERPAR